MKTSYIDFKFYIWDTHIKFDDNVSEITVHTPYARHRGDNETIFAGHLKHVVDTPNRMAVLRRMADKGSRTLYSDSRGVDLTLDDILYSPESENWGMVEEIATNQDDCI